LQAGGDSRRPPPRRVRRRQRRQQRAPPELADALALAIAREERDVRVRPGVVPDRDRLLRRAPPRTGAASP